MKKFIVVLMTLVLALGLLAACGKKSETKPTDAPTTTAPTETVTTPTENPTEAPTDTPTDTPAPTAEPDDPTKKSEGVMTHAEFVAAEDEAPIVIECYVQDHQSWWDNTITVYAADPEGAYFIYKMVCSEEDSKKLVPGTKIRVKGFRTTWSGEIEVAEGSTFEILEGSYIAPAVDLTPFITGDTIVSEVPEIVALMNHLVTVKGLKVTAAPSYKGDARGDDIYLRVSINGVAFNLVVESYLRGEDTEVYKTVENLKEGDIIDVDAYLYWYNGANPHIVNVTVQQ